MMWTAVLPDGSRIPLEGWVVREWKAFRHMEVVAPDAATFFDTELASELATAVALYPRHAC